MSLTAMLGKFLEDLVRSFDSFLELTSLVVVQKILE